MRVGHCLSACFCRFPVAVLGANAGLLLRKLDNNVFAQIGLVMLIGLTAKNAILIVEFAILENKNKNKGLVEAALEGARLRLRPILMTSFCLHSGMCSSLDSERRRRDWPQSLRKFRHHRHDCSDRPGRLPLFRFYTLWLNALLGKKRKGRWEFQAAST